jgi:uncharacterized radical SAM superfamily Fe-S cluster-containing enzyme
MQERPFRPFFNGGAPRTPLGLPRTTGSICPECLEVIPARLFEREGKVFMEKSCPSHGAFEDLVSASAAVFLRMERYAAEGAWELTNPVTEDPSLCPHGCGLCPGHLSPAAMTNLDLTNRCNLRCPFCFANANVQPYVYEPSFGQIRAMLDRTLSMGNRRMQAIQFSGGEPTLSPHFLEACREVKRRGINMIQVATNGIRFAREPGFAEAAAEAGLNAAYLQFDGVGDEVYRVTRGVKGLWEVKQRAMEAFRRAGIRVTLVPTLIRGVNDDQVGAIVRYAIEHLDTIVGISLQPVAFTGRIEQTKRLAQRYTSADAALDIERQTGFLKAERDWFPFSVTVPFAKVVDNVLGRDRNGFLPMLCNAHPDCGLSAYLLVNQRTGACMPVNELFDIDAVLRGLVDMERRSREGMAKALAAAQFFALLLRHFRPEKAPEGLGFLQLAKTIDAISGNRVMHIAKKRRYEWRLLFIASMHFMDAYNYQVDRVRRCTIHYSAPDGRLYPFCTYNCGHVFRDEVERAHSVPKDEWVRSRGAQYVTGGFVE